MEENFKEIDKDEKMKYEEHAILSSQFKRKKTITWFIRTVLAVILFTVFWKYTWVRWALAFYIPLNLFSLYAIHKFDSTVNKKMNEVMTKIIDLEAEIAATEEE